LLLTTSVAGALLQAEEADVYTDVGYLSIETRCEERGSGMPQYRASMRGKIERSQCARTMQGPMIANADDQPGARVS
jgi:hypothetical protein